MNGPATKNENDLFSVMIDSKGRWKLLSILVVIIITSSFIAHVISTSGFKVNVKDLYIDSEGAIMNATYTRLLE